MCVFSIIAIILGLSASLVNGSSAAAIKNIATCSSPSGQLFGSLDVQFAGLALNCSSTNPSFDCACVTAINIDTCLLFDGRTNCNDITGHYLQILQASTAFSVLALLSVFALSLVTCCSLCCPGYLGDDQLDMPPAGVRYGADPPPAYAHTQPGVVYVGSIATAAPMEGSAQPVPYHMQGQVQQLRMYEQQQQRGGGAVATAVAVPYDAGKQGGL